MDLKYYDFLMIFIAYNKTCLNWAEAHPELSYEADKRVIDNYGVMIKEEPKLADFFKNYHGKRELQSERRLNWLSEENRRLIESERKMNDSLTRTVEALKEEKEVRQKFVDALTHDLRTPLSSVKLGLEFLQRHNIEEKLRKLLERSLKSIKRLDQKIEDLLDVSRLRGGQGPTLKKHKIDLKSLLTDIVSDQVVEVKDRRILKSFNMPAFEGFWDPDAIKRVMENLINNAIKYGYEDTPVIISFHKMTDRVFVTVQNFGKGLKEKDQQSIFSPFYRVKGTESKGWGIGLTIVKSLIEAHGGHIAMKSLEDEEIVLFTFDLPLLEEPYQETGSFV